MTVFAPDPIGLPGLAAFSLGAFAFLAAVLAARARGGGDREAGARRSRGSMFGVGLQGLGIAIAGFGPQRVTLDPMSALALGEAALVAALMSGAVGLFLWASGAMGRNWSIVARTRADHELVQTGAFAHLRHPIYTGMTLFIVALAIAFGHSRQLVLAAPVFAAGAALRVRIEERMLRDLFGDAYRAYAARVSRFVPRLF